MSDIIKRKKLAQSLIAEFQTYLEEQMKTHYGNQPLEELDETSVNETIGPLMQKWFESKFELFRSERNVEGAMVLRAMAEHLLKDSEG